MENENLIEELRSLRRVLESLLYATWALGAMQNVRARTGSQSQEFVELSLGSPEGGKLALEALKGFGSLATFVMNEFKKVESTLLIPPPWKM
jgi:hypothetical protein